METSVNIEVATLDAPHRRALEEVIGLPLSASQRLLIGVMEGAAPETAASRQAQALEDWTSVYDGLSDEEIESLDKIAKTRTNLTRNLPQRWTRRCSTRTSCPK